VNPQIFREYDIRGIADRDLDDDLVRDLGHALGTYLRRKGAKRVALGRDARLSSERLRSALSQGLLQTGLDLVDIGVAATPLLYFTVFHLELDGGVQITGSHNPPAENGFKMMCGKQTLFGEAIQQLRAMIEQRDFDLSDAGEVQQIDIMPAYVGYLRGNIQLKRTDLRVIIDAGNGCGGPPALESMRALGLSPAGMFCEMDGSFPNHHPDPTQPENLSALIERVRSGEFEIGLAFDGDADRLGVIDDRGDIIWGDKLMVLFSRQVLKKHPGAAVIGEVKCSQTLYDDIAAHGGRPIIWKTGHSLIKSKLKEEHALLAGEMSGHLFFADKYYGFDDAIYASLRLLEILAEERSSLHELLADLPQTHVTPEIRVPCDDSAKFAVVERVLNRFRPHHRVLDVDGARIMFDDGWGLVRASNTQPVLVLRFEAQSAERLAAIKSEVENAVEECRQESA
jgi:phosphomannomutase/phosphoglucomutase